MKISSLGLQKTIHLLWDSDHPESSYTFLSNNFVNSFVSDSNFDQILDKLVPLYTHKPRIEAKGTLNKIHDFVVKLASVVYGPLRSFRGILIEVQIFFSGGSIIKINYFENLIINIFIKTIF